MILATGADPHYINEVKRIMPRDIQVPLGLRSSGDERKPLTTFD
jgi:hypothetical protein